MAASVFHNPPELPHPDSYTHVVSTTGSSKIIYVSGQTVKEGNLEQQTEAVLTNIRTGLRSSGADMQNIVKIGVFVKNYDSRKWPTIRKVLEKFFEPNRWPASTLLGVQNLCE